MNKEEIALKLTEIYVSNWNVTSKTILTRREIGEIYNEYLFKLENLGKIILYKGEK